MAKFAIQTLEFDKVKEMLAGKTATSLGRERVMNMRIESDFASVKRLQEETAEALHLLDDGKRFPFGGAYNILPQVKRARIGSVLEPEELMQVGTTCEALRMVKQFLADEAEIAPQLAEYAAGLEAFPKLERIIASTVSEKGEILDSASTKLAGLRTGVQVAKNRVREKLDSILHDPNNQKYFQDALVTMRGDRYVIPIKQEYRYNFPGVVHDQSGSGATLFIEPMAVVNLNNDIKRYLAQEQEEIERILRSISGMVGADAARITQAMEELTELDFIAARAYLAQQQKAVRPVVNIGGGIEIAKGRHPLLDPQKVVPLDIEIGGRFNTLLITGPNTGGKTVALKTVGLFMLMVQAGLFVPAVSAKMPVIGAVYADIGDEQSIEQSLSTFSGHMTNMVEILKQVKAGELVLIDELCAGTDPNEGAALAMSILEHLHKRGVLTIVTTHYSELKTFAYGRQGMENASVEFDPVSLRPTYRLLMGVPGSSNAFNISRRLGLDDDIIENAGSFLTQEHVHMEDVLKELEGERREYETQNREIRSLKADSERIKQELQHQKQELEHRKNEILRKAREQADELYRSSRRETEAVLKELRKMKTDFDAKQLQAAAEAARKKLQKSFAAETPVPEGEPLTPQTAKAGQTVFLKSLGKDGTIIAVNGSEVTVQIGILKTTVKAKDCIAMRGKAKSNAAGENFGKKRKGFAHQFFVSKSIGARTEVDVRGMTMDEAIPAVDKAMDDALLAGLTSLRIIHGKGTGALKAGLTAYLSTHASVKSLAEAPLNEGGSGATIINF